MNRFSEIERLNLELLGEDKCLKEIANIRGCSFYTVRAQLEQSKAKMGVHTAPGAVAKYLKMKYAHMGIAVLLALILTFGIIRHQHNLITKKIDNYSFRVR